MNLESLVPESLDRALLNSTTRGRFHFPLNSNFVTYQTTVKGLDLWLNHFVAEDELGQFDDEGGDLAIFLKESSMLEDDLGRKAFKKILKEIQRYDWVTKLEIYLEIGPYF